MKLMGFALVVIAILTLVLGGIGYNRQRTMTDMGPLEATATEHQTMRLSPLAGVIALLSGIVMVGIPRRPLGGA